MGMGSKQKDAYDCLISMAADVQNGRYGIYLIDEEEDFDKTAFDQDLIETFELEI